MKLTYRFGQKSTLVTQKNFTVKSNRAVVDTFAYQLFALKTMLMSDFLFKTHIWKYYAFFEKFELWKFVFSNFYVEKCKTSICRLSIKVVENFTAYHLSHNGTQLVSPSSSYGGLYFLTIFLLTLIGCKDWKISPRRCNSVFIETWWVPKVVYRCNFSCKILSVRV